MFYKHVNMRISSLINIKLKRLINDIKRKSLQKIVQIMKLMENQEKRTHRSIEPA